MICCPTKNNLPCVREKSHQLHMNTEGKCYYYGDDMQPGMPKRYIDDHTPLIQLIYQDLNPQLKPTSYTYKYPKNY